MQRCNHSFDGVNLICPYGCHGQVSKALEEITHLVRPKQKPWFVQKKTLIDLTGQTFGKLKVDKHTGGPYVSCTCECGEITIRDGKDLRAAAKKGISSCCSKCLIERKKSKKWKLNL